MSEKTTVLGFKEMEGKYFRYPGAQPFKVGEAGIFFGREKDIEDFYNLLNLEDIVVLHSKSGLGKSSLLNAGIITKLNKSDKYMPIPIRLGPYVDTVTARLPVQISRAFIASADTNTLLDKIAPSNQSLWTALKKRSLSNSGKEFVLIFDQFEELFTYPETAILSFKAALLEVLNTTIISYYRTALEERFAENATFLSDEEMDLIHQPLAVKIVMAIRSDRMSLMNQLSDYLPNILTNCYELQPLTAEQAEDAILNPAFLPQNGFITPPFDYEDEAIEAIIAALTRNRSQKIESFQLQILCQSIEQKVIKQQLSIIHQADLGDFQKIYKYYYQDQIALLPNQKDQYAARVFIEEGLIFEEEERRLNMYEGQIFKIFDISPQLLRQLVDTHLLRAEPSMRGGFTYELSHDTLVAPVLEAKRKRNEIEQQKAAKEIEQERAKEMEALRAEAKLERRKRRQARILASWASVVSVIAIIACIIAFNSYRKAALKTEEANQALIDLKASNAEKEAAKFQNHFDLGVNAFDNHNYSLAVEEFERALLIKQEDKLTLNKKKESKAKLSTVTQFNELIKQGEIFENQGKTQYYRALLSYKKAQIVDGDNPEAKNKIAVLQPKLNAAFNEFINDAATFMRAKEYVYAKRSYEHALKIKPNNLLLQQKIKACNQAMNK